MGLPIEPSEAGDEGPHAAGDGETLYAFYDLDICTVTFDFFSFLLRAELFRESNGFKRLFVVFVPGSHDGFRLMHHDGEASRWRMRNIHGPGCWFLRSVCGMVHCVNRPQAAAIEAANEAAIFPVGYTTRIVDSQRAIDAMIDAFMFSGLVAEFVKGADIPVLSPSATAVAWVDSWLKAHCSGKRPVVMTLREARYDRLRNSNLAAWARFASELDQEKYAAVIVRDTDAVFDPVPDEIKGFAICAEASLDVQVRLALYEAAHLNLLVNNGPLALCYLNPKIRYLVFKHFTLGQSEVARATFAVYGIPLFGQTPLSTSAQRNAWKDDTYENIAEEFSKMSAFIEAEEEDGRKDTLSARKALTVDEALQSAVSMHSVGRIEPAAAIYEHLRAQHPYRADIAGMLGLARHHQGRDADARILLTEAIGRAPDKAIHHFNLGIVLRATGAPEGAITAFEDALGCDPQMRAAHENLGDIFVELENWKVAARHYGAAIDLGSTDSRTFRALAVCLEELGERRVAFSLYRQIIRHAERQQEVLDEALKTAQPQLENRYDDLHDRFVLPSKRASALREAS
ncbi:MAG: tetratricopeptide repeat protein [Kiloniellales bacterium]|nr:tetratricopeptide repeat protein [Kiloniellales bacterium]